MKKFIKLLRPKNYIKNVFILLPAIFSKQLFNTSALPDLLWGILSFCALSSAVYIFNDLCDAEQDKSHPIKRNRPIAKGEISKKSGFITIFILLILCAVTNYLSDGTKTVTWLLLLVYLVQNILYSVKLKQIPVLDVAILALGFLIRVFYGSAILNVDVSKWLYLTVISISFYIGFGKRRNELALSENSKTRAVLTNYSFNFLDKNMYMCSTLTIVFYSLWSVDATTIANLGSNKIIWTIPLVILICITYSLSVEKCRHDDPIDIIFSNKFLLLLLAIYGLFLLEIIYLNDHILFELFS